MNNRNQQTNRNLEGPVFILAASASQTPAPKFPDRQILVGQIRPA
jgi:hypothetical protein